MSCAHHPLISQRWSEIAAKAIVSQPSVFESLPDSLVGLKRAPVPAGQREWTFHSRKLRRPVTCESATELRVFSWLERALDVRWYQEQPVAIPYRFAGQNGLYFPDAAVWDQAGRIILLEVKPLHDMYRLDTVVKALAALECAWARGMGYLLVDERGRTVRDLARLPFDLMAAQAIESLFVHGPVPFRLVKNSLRMRAGCFDTASLGAIVVNRDWSVTRAPGVRVSSLPPGLSFRLLRGPASSE